MSDDHRPSDTTPPADAPGERRLARAPSERYGPARVEEPPQAATAGAGPGAVGAAPARGVAFGAVAAIVGAGVIVLFGGAMAVSAGLLVVAVAIGYFVAVGTLAGAGGTISSPARSWLAAGLAGLGVVMGQVGLWLFARSEGGVLEPVDYLGQTFGVLVPLQVLLAAVAAWWRAR